MKIVFATNNEHKIAEVKAALPQQLSIITLKEAGINIDIPEPHATLEENAAEKARTIFSLTQLNCFSEDTGLEVAALNGEPGVHSARYAGEASSSQQNIAKLLGNMRSMEDREAQFRTVIFLIFGGKEYHFQGVCRGAISKYPMGTEGFGYDAVFIPEGASRTFGEMSLEEKNRYSHRRKAVDKLVAFLNQSQVKLGI
ncbi:MAG TPA: RdgB/HAM1 family non-canonical purine NTP pyrophosphatase [Chitinophagaceae bacterium]|nr:RdgB/HAM1 family non-canonical purine NTP pyrophosphatase [Chitinophagaceae bacterium]